eukprot:1082251-Rhodomonas_salina.2
MLAHGPLWSEMFAVFTEDAPGSVICDVSAGYRIACAEADGGVTCSDDAVVCSTHSAVGWQCPPLPELSPRIDCLQRVQGREMLKLVTSRDGRSSGAVEMLELWDQMVGKWEKGTENEASGQSSCLGLT